VHEDILCKGSPFFASACKEEWKQGREHYIPLKGDEPSIVDLYLQWIYTGRIFSRPSDEGGPEGEGELGILVEGYIFGEKVQNGDFKDAVVDAIVKCFPIPSKKNKVGCPPVLCVDKAYGGTPEGSQLRKLLVAIYATRGSRAWLRGTTSMEFLADLAARLLDERKWPTAGLDLTAVSSTNTVTTSPAIESKLWVTWYEGIVRVSFPSCTSSRVTGPARVCGKDICTTRSNLPSPSHPSLVHLELLGSPVLVCHVPLVMHATEVLRSPRLAPGSGHDLPGCDAAACLP
jgi:hypothetical protein